MVKADLDVAGQWEDPEHTHPTGHTRNWCPVTNIYKKRSRASLKSPQFLSIPTQFLHLHTKVGAPHAHPATLNVQRFGAYTVVQHFSFGIKVRKAVAHLIVCVHGIVDSAEPAIDAATWALSEEDLQIFVFVDGVQAFVHPFATKLVLSLKAVVGLTAKSDHSIPFPFLLEESRLSFVVGTMFGCVRTWKPIRFIFPECLSQFRLTRLSTLSPERAM